MKRMLNIFLVILLVSCNVELENKVKFEETLNIIVPYDNGIKDTNFDEKDKELFWYFDTYMNQDLIKIEIYYQNNVVNTYFVIIKDLENNKYKKIYVDEEVINSIKDELKKLGFIESYRG